MSLIHLIGVGIGALISSVSRFFWLEMCIFSTKFGESLTVSTCEGFGNFFYYAGIIITLISLFHVFKK
ncbi:MAG: hypothetical protein ACOC1K_03765 [Nanoarchaeota archaeon]